MIQCFFKTFDVDELGRGTVLSWAWRIAVTSAGSSALFVAAVKFVEGAGMHAAAGVLASVALAAAAVLTWEV